MRHIYRMRGLLPALGFWLSLATPAGAADNPTAPAELSLEELMQVEVTSVSRKPQSLANVAAAVFVIGAEDIRLSGANSIPEALRLAPGIQASRISGNRWSVSARGFADYFADKLLVLVDGRDTYNPAFGGTVWQDLQFPMDDIERIEVIRGPAAALWGSNGINGVINIITKSAAATQGGQLGIGAGNSAGEFGHVRWGGGTTDQNLFYRGYISGENGNSGRAIPSMGGGDGHDSYNSQAGGLRLDGYLSGGARWDFSADLFKNSADTMAYVATSTSGNNQQFNENHKGATLRGRYQDTISDNNEIQLQSSLSYTNLQVPFMLTDRRMTADIGLQDHIKVAAWNDLVWGADYRLSRDDISTTPYLHLDSLSEHLNYYGLFGQDEIRLFDNLRLTVGARMDHNDYTGWTPQPTARLAWNVDPTQTLWGSVSKASRAPSRGERGFSLNENYTPGTPFPNTLVVLHGDKNFGNERINAAEAGLRSQWTSRISTDGVVFVHQYNNLRASGPPVIDASTFPLVVANVPVVNGGAMVIRGAELAADWHISSDWRLQLSQTVNDAQHAHSATIDFAGQVPKFISSFRASWAPTPDVNVDAWFRYTDKQPAPLSPVLQRQAFTSLDMRVAWRPRQGLELSLTGQNLINSECDEYKRLLITRETENMIPTCQPRRVIGAMRIEF